MFSSPVTISNRMPADQQQQRTRAPARARASAPAASANSRGITDHSLASTTGTRTSPSPTCTPWVSRKSHDGRVGQSNAGSAQQPDVARDGLARPVGDVVEQAGDDHHRQPGEQHDAEHRGQPRPAQRAAELGVARSGHGAHAESGAATVAASRWCDRRSGRRGKRLLRLTVRDASRTGPCGLRWLRDGPGAGGGGRRDRPRRGRAATSATPATRSTQAADGPAGLRAARDRAAGRRGARPDAARHDRPGRVPGAARRHTGGCRS